MEVLALHDRMHAPAPGRWTPGCQEQVFSQVRDIFASAQCIPSPMHEHPSVVAVRSVCVCHCAVRSSQQTVCPPSDLQVLHDEDLQELGAADGHPEVGDTGWLLVRGPRAAATFGVMGCNS
jgi:hypothetical protein